MKKELTSLLAAVIRRAPAELAQALAARAKAVVARRDLGAAYQAARQEICCTEWLTASERQAFELRKMKRIVLFAWDHCQGYREHWQKHGFSPEKLRKPDDVRRIPEVTKELLRDNIDKFSARSDCKYITTSGSTGIPLGFYLDRQAEATELAFLHHIWEQRGFRPDGRSVIIRGSAVQGGYNGSSCAELTIFGDLLLSAYKITRESAPEYIEAINSFRPQCIQAYPSALAELTKVCIDVGLEVNTPVSCIILASEKLYESDRQLLKGFWRVPLVHYYGMTEKAALAGPCRTSDLFHVYPQYGLVEVLKEDGSEAGDGETGQIVATSFFMQATPFIRYRPGDLAVSGSDRCPECNRHYRLLREIVGRSGEFIQTGDGRKLPFSMAIGSIHDSLLTHVEQFQFRHPAPGKLVCAYVSRGAMPERQKQAIIAEIIAKVGEGVQVSFEQVAAISKSVNGKHNFFMSGL